MASNLAENLNGIEKHCVKAHFWEENGFQDVLGFIHEDEIGFGGRRGPFPL